VTTLAIVALSVAYGVAKALSRHYFAWRLYVERNEAALRESGMRPGGSMSFGRYLRDPMSRMIYGARYDVALREQLAEAGYEKAVL